MGTRLYKHAFVELIEEDMPKWVLITFVVCVGMFFLVRFDRSDEKQAIIEKRQELVGESIRLRTGDTVKIYRYHIIHDEFILENAMHVSPEMVATLLIR